jgi:hypothetical protein
MTEAIVLHDLDGIRSPGSTRRPIVINNDNN